MSKYRYYKICSSIVWGKNVLTKDDLIQVRQGAYDTIIDVQENKQYNAENNEWEEIKGE